MRVWFAKLALSSIVFSSAVLGHSATLKIAALAPPGTTWADNLEALAKEVKKATDSRVKVKLYLGGVAGDEPDVLRKIHIGQLHGGVFTGKALGEIFSDVRVLEIPFNFTDDRQMMLKTLNGLEEYFNEGFRKNGFENLGFFEIGEVYFVSKTEAKSIAGLKGMKIWAWEGDPLVKAMMETLDLVSVPLALPDVLNSLSTGIIEAAYASPLGIIALQWQSKVDFLINFPVSYGVSGLLVSKKTWDKIKPDDQKVIRGIVEKFVKETNEFTAKENARSLASLKSLGVKFVEFPKADIAKSQEIRKQVLAKLKGNMLSEKVIALFDKQLSQ